MSGYKYFTVVFLLGVSGTAGYLAVAHAKPKPDTLEVVNGPEFSLGELHEGRYPGTFQLANHTESEVEIVGIKKSCSCSSVKARSELAAKETITVEYVWDTTGHSGDVYVDTVFIYCSDKSPSDRNAVRVRLTAHVTPDFQLNTEAIDLYLGTIKDTFELKLRGVQVKDCKLIAVSSSHPVICCELVNETMARVSLDPKKAADFNDNSAFLSLTTTSKNRPNIALPVFVHR
jgi:Protein of unknown function (DUF1573)